MGALPGFVPTEGLRSDDFEGFFAQRRELLCKLVEKAIAKSVPRDLDDGSAEEDSAHR
jgi:hypothetical protein